MFENARSSLLFLQIGPYLSRKLINIRYPNGIPCPRGKFRRHVNHSLDRLDAVPDAYGSLDVASDLTGRSQRRDRSGDYQVGLVDLEYLGVGFGDDVAPCEHC